MRKAAGRSAQLPPLRDQDQYRAPRAGLTPAGSSDGGCSGVAARAAGTSSTAPLVGSTIATPEARCTGDGRNPLGIQLAVSQAMRRRPAVASEPDSASEPLYDAITTPFSSDSPAGPTTTP